MGVLKITHNNPQKIFSKINQNCNIVVISFLASSNVNVSPTPISLTFATRFLLSMAITIDFLVMSL